MDIYLIMIIALAILAIGDLVVGVSNDAVNFLNSALGSKALSVRNIMILASLGVAVGAVFSSGMMEVARKGIFNPDMFFFSEIMIIFMAVMITDILLLDFFNTLGMPTSTTVSIVFELLGAAVAVSLIKIFANGGDASLLVDYINVTKATQIIGGILLSVFVAFSVGAVVQYVSRFLLSYNYEQKANWVGSLFGGVALTSITYFILMKGIKGTAYAKQSFEILDGSTIANFMETQVVLIAVSLFILLSLFSYIIISVFKISIYKIIIGVGTFSLALAFAGNDLVNFIGVPIAAWQSYEAWSVSGMQATEFSMAVLSKKVPTPTLLLFLAGMVMVVTLWISSKAKKVTKTEIDLARQQDTKERFNPNFLSRGLVRASMNLSNVFSKIVPNNLQKHIDSQFEKPAIELSSNKSIELPAFDMIRAAVNMMVAAILISIATSFKLPLSTTYVTFMVAMGTSLADRAWGSESAVYRVAGVLNVIGGWFFTAFIAFVGCGTIAFLINLGGPTAIAILLFLALLLLARNYISHRKETAQIKNEDALSKAESSSIQGVILESSNNVSKASKKIKKVFAASISGLATQDLSALKKNKKEVKTLADEIEDLRNDLFYFIKNLDESTIKGASNFYINVLGSLQDISESLQYISKVTFKHINNNHKALTFNQIRELKEISLELETLFERTKFAFSKNNFKEISSILDSKQELLDSVREKINNQISRTKSEESSPKNTTLYFSILTESKDLIKATMAMLELYNDQYDSSIEPPLNDE
ncbi:MAG: inorganic phosphate transporter [Flavobacteriales bacterium]|jgi:phosphate/sulfate permease|nr:MAG: inorganic phosphate transporter [Flavobacteriales bacterium]